MYMLQLFDIDDAVQPIDARLFATGNLTIGRDAAADWSIADPNCEVSRNHCELRISDNGLSLHVSGANGVYDDFSGARYPDDAEFVLSLPATLRLGRFRIVIAPAPLAASPSGAADRTMVLTPPLGTSTDVPSEWDEPTDQSTPASGTLLEAFCQGAQLDASLLSSEDPDEIMRRAGALYRQMVLGIGDLMSERNAARQRYSLNRTTMSGQDNNPFKWAPSQRLAVDLLLAESTGFMSGPTALQASFRDVKRHLVATFAGMRGSLRAAINHLNPDRLDGSGSRRKTLLQTRSQSALEQLRERHTELCSEIADGVPGALDRAFVVAYDEAETVADKCD